MSRLKKLFAIRHCQDFSDDDLTEEGIEQAKALGLKILEAINATGKSVVLSSPPGRATMTATLIAKTLAVKVEIVEELGLESYKDSLIQVKAISKFLDLYENVIVITHFTAPSGIVNTLLKQSFGKNFPRHEKSKGHGFLFNNETGEVSNFP